MKLSSNSFEMHGNSLENFKVWSKISKFTQKFKVSFIFGMNYHKVQMNSFRVV